jgi:transposase
VLGTVDPQLSLLDTGSLLEGLVEEDSFYGRLARHGRSLICDEEFSDCYANGRGRPSIPPSTLMLACLLAMHDGTSDRQTAQQVRLNLGWKTALGLPIDHPGFHPTTFSVFRSRIVLHDKDEALFRTVVGRAIAAGVVPKRSLQLIDSSPILGAGAVKDTYELLRSGIQKLVGAAGTDSLSKTMQRRLKRYLREAKPNIDWHDAGARRAELARIVEVADRLLVVVVERSECDEAAGLLRQLLV